MSTRVYVIEDETASCRILEEILAGFNGAFSFVAAYATAEDALLEISGVTPHVMLVDVGLPGISGIELTRRAKHN